MINNLLSTALVSLIRTQPESKFILKSEDIAQFNLTGTEIDVSIDQHDVLLSTVEAPAENISIRYLSRFTGDFSCFDIPCDKSMPTMVVGGKNTASYYQNGTKHAIPLHAANGKSKIESVCILTDFICIARDDGSLTIAPRKAPQMLYSFSDLRNDSKTFVPVFLCRSADGRVLGVLGNDGSVRFIRPADESRTSSVSILKKGIQNAMSICFSDISLNVFIADVNSNIRIINYSTGHEVHKIKSSKNDGVIRAMAYTHNRQLLAVCQDAKVKIYPLFGVQPLKTFLIHSENVVAAALSTHGRFLATASIDNTLCISDLIADFHQQIELPGLPYKLCWIGDRLHVGCKGYIETYDTTRLNKKDTDFTANKTCFTALEEELSRSL